MKHLILFLEQYTEEGLSKRYRYWGGFDGGFDDVSSSCFEEMM